MIFTDKYLGLEFNSQHLHNNVNTMKLKVAPWFEASLEYLWSIRAQIIEDEETNKAHLGDVFGFNFSYPDYAGLPKSISNKLPNSVIDLIHHETYFLLKASKNKRDFFKRMLKEITNECVIY
jgi:hypothetical protein